MLLNPDFEFSSQDLKKKIENVKQKGVNVKVC